jgi:hypothetical protein
LLAESSVAALETAGSPNRFRYRRAMTCPGCEYSHRSNLFVPRPT